MQQKEAELERKEYCPFLKKTCIGKKCQMFIQLHGANPNGVGTIDKWDCSLAWTPILLIENSQQQYSTGAAVESFRNEMVKAHAAMNAAHEGFVYEVAKFVGLKTMGVMLPDSPTPRRSSNGPAVLEESNDQPKATQPDTGTF